MIIAIIAAVAHNRKEAKITMFELWRQTKLGHGPGRRLGMASAESMIGEISFNLNTEQDSE
jgi:hypothetical protein